MCGRYVITKPLFKTKNLVKKAIKVEDSVDLTTTSSKSPNGKKCHNRFDMDGFQVAKDCTRCTIGQHEKGGKCVSNLDGCKDKTLTSNGCKKCKPFWWQTKSTAQGNYCYNRWWMWVIIFSCSIMG